MRQKLSMQILDKNQTEQDRIQTESRQTSGSQKLGRNQAENRQIKGRNKKKHEQEQEQDKQKGETKGTRKKHGRPDINKIFT